MRLKTLRKERPAFENEGAVINGNRMDLSNNESKPNRQRSNNSFVLPTSLSHELSSLNISPSDFNDDILTTTNAHSTSTHQFPVHSNTSGASTTNPISSYQAIEAAYREHGIRIHLDPLTAAAIAQPLASTNNSHRSRLFVNRNPSRASSALHYADAPQGTTQDSRPFSAFHHASNEQFQTTAHPIELSHVPAQPHQDFSSVSLLGSEHSTPMTPEHLPAVHTNGTTLVDDDPDLAYMSTLLKTTNGDSFRDTIRRRAGLRGTFAVHRHPQANVKTEPKAIEILPSPDPVTTQRNSVLRYSTNPIVSPPISSKKVEKDILKHASRIRTSHSKDIFPRQNSPNRSRRGNRTPSMSTSLTRTYLKETKRTKFKKSSKTMSLEPLELLLSPARCPSPIPMHFMPFSSRNSTPDRPPSKTRRFIRRSARSSRERTIKSANSSRLHPGVTRSLCFNDPSNPVLISSHDNLSSTHLSPLYLITTIKPHSTNSFDSSGYDRSSRSNSSHDIHSLASSSAQQTPASTIRVTSSTTTIRQSILNKKVSFGNRSPRLLITTTTTYI